MYKIVVSREARNQIAQVLAYTSEHFGWRKQLDYAALIEDALTVLSGRPEAGKRRPDINPDALVFPIARAKHKARHLLLYRLKDDRVEVVGFLYDGMDLSRHWPDGR